MAGTEMAVQPAGKDQTYFRAVNMPNGQLMPTALLFAFLVARRVRGEIPKPTSN